MGKTHKSPAGPGAAGDAGDDASVASKFTQIRQEEWGLADPDLLASLSRGQRIATPVKAPPEAALLTMEVTSADFVDEDVVVLTGGVSPDEDLPPPHQPSLAERLGQIASFSEPSAPRPPADVAPPLVWDDEETRLKAPEPEGRLGQVIGSPASDPAYAVMPPEDPAYEFHGSMSLAEGASLDAVLSGRPLSGPSDGGRSKWNISSDDEFVVPTVPPEPYDDRLEAELFESSGPPSLADGVAAIAARLEERTGNHRLARGGGVSRSSQSIVNAVSQSSARARRPEPAVIVADDLQPVELPTRELDPYAPQPVAYEAEPVAYEAEPVAYEAEPIPYDVEPIPYDVEPIPYDVEPIPYDADPTPFESDPHAYEPGEFDERPTSLMPPVEVQDALSRPAESIDHRRTTVMPSAADMDDDVRPTHMLQPLDPQSLHTGDSFPQPLHVADDPAATQPMASPREEAVALEPEVVHGGAMELRQPIQGMMPQAEQQRYGRRIMVIEEPAPQYNYNPQVAEVDPFQASPTIPFMNTAPEPARPLQRVTEAPLSRPPAADLEGVRNLPLHRGKIDGRLLVLHDPEGEIASKYRLLDFKLRRIAETRPLRTLALTAPQAQSGTTLTAVNLALIRAESPSARVCVVDLNFRDPNLHRLIGLEPSFTLSDYLAEEASLDQVLVKLEGAPCYLIPAGPARMPPSRLYKHPRLTELFAVLYDTFDLVIMDLPPVLPKADINQVDPLIDAIVMVVAAGKTTGPALRKAKKTIDGEKLVGVVLNEG